VTADASGYLQWIALDVLFGIHNESGLTVRIEPSVGDFVLQGTVIASIWPESAASDDVTGAVRGAYQLGRERTLAADVEFGLQQLADIAIKALSPGINDPTTATICIDRLGELLGRIAVRKQPQTLHTRKDSRVWVLLSPAPVVRLVDTAFAQIRHYGAGDAVVMAHLVMVLGNLSHLVLPVHQPIFATQIALVLAAAHERLALAVDRERVDVAAANVADAR
jgi:uncharacterized membrane protein